MEIKATCTAVVQVELPRGSNGMGLSLNVTKYRCEFDGDDGGKYKVICDSPAFTPGNKHIITID